MILYLLEIGPVDQENETSAQDNKIFQMTNLIGIYSGLEKSQERT